MVKRTKWNLFCINLLNSFFFSPHKLIISSAVRSQHGGEFPVISLLIFFVWFNDAGTISKGSLLVIVHCTWLSYAVLAASGSRALHHFIIISSSFHQNWFKLRLKYLDWRWERCRSDCPGSMTWRWRAGAPLPERHSGRRLYFRAALSDYPPSSRTEVKSLENKKTRHQNDWISSQFQQINLIIDILFL